MAPKFHIVFQIILLGGCFVVDIVYFSFNLFTGGLFTCRVHTTNCCDCEPSENKAMTHCSAVQSSYFVAKSKRLNMTAVIRRGLRAGLCDLGPNSVLMRREMVIGQHMYFWHAKLHVSFFMHLMKSESLCVSPCSHLRYLFSMNAYFFLCRENIHSMKIIDSVVKCCLSVMQFYINFAF